MNIRRRDLFAGTLAAAVSTAVSRVSAQDEAPGKTPEIPKRKASVEKLYKTLSTHPNALEATADGLWVGDQISEVIYKVDWATGKTILQFPSESHNTSGVAVGGGYVWLAANRANTRRAVRPSDHSYGEILQVDMKTGKTLKAYKLAWDGNHGLTYNNKTGKLWALALGVMALAEMDPMDNMRILRMFPVRGDRPHGFDWDESGDIWLAVSGDKIIERRDGMTGRIKEVLTFAPGDPDPHGVAIRDGYLYMSDAGVGSTPSSKGSDPGSIYRAKL